MICYQSIPGGVQARDSVTMREVPLGKKLDMKYMQVNVLRSIARMTKISGDIRTD